MFTYMQIICYVSNYDICAKFLLCGFKLRLPCCLVTICLLSNYGSSMSMRNMLCAVHRLDILKHYQHVSMMIELKKGKEACFTS